MDSQEAKSTIKYADYSVYSDKAKKYPRKLFEFRPRVQEISPLYDIKFQHLTIEITLQNSIPYPAILVYDMQVWPCGVV